MSDIAANALTPARINSLFLTALANLPARCLRSSSTVYSAFGMVKLSRTSLDFFSLLALTSLAFRVALEAAFGFAFATAFTAALAASLAVVLTADLTAALVLIAGFLTARFVAVFGAAFAATTGAGVGALFVVGVIETGVAALGATMVFSVVVMMFLSFVKRAI